VTPEERARAVVAYFPAIPERIRREAEAIIARAIRRAVAQELTGLAQRADMEAIRADGRGKQAKGQDISALRTHRWWEEKFEALRQSILSRESRAEGAKPKVEEETRNAKAARASAASTPRLVRTRTLKAGDLVLVNPCTGAYTDLPEGLPANTRVTVVSTDRGTVVVADPSGKQFKVFLPNIEMPCDIWWKGRWIDRFRDPEGEEAYRRVVGR
jgi:hypothetical protein